MCQDVNYVMLIWVSKIVTIPVRTDRDGLPSGSMGIRGMPTKKQKYSSLICFAQSETHIGHIEIFSFKENVLGERIHEKCEREAIHAFKRN